MRTFISKYRTTEKLYLFITRFIYLLFVINCIAVFECYSQESCVFLDYEPVVCKNEPIQFVLKNKGACTINNIVWVFNNTTNVTDTLMGAGPHSVSFIKTGITNFSIKYYDADLEVQESKELSFNVIEPVVSLTIEPLNPCIGQTIKLKANGHKEGFFVWKGDLEKKGENLFEVIDTVNTNKQGYLLGWYLGTNGTDRGCKYRSFKDTVLAKKMPALEIDPSNELNICEGDVVSLNIKNTNSVNNYLWKGEDLVVSNTSLNIKPKNSTNITVSTFENGCLRSENVSINVQKIPSFSIEPANATICKGSSIALNIISDNFENETDFVWSGGTIKPLNQFNRTVEATPGSTVTYNVLWEYNGCKASANTTIKVTESTTNVIGNKIVNICNGEAIELSANTPTNGVVKWYEKDFPNPVEASKITVSPEKTTTYEILWTDGKCADSGTITVIVNPKPNLNIVSSVGSRVCKGELINLQVFSTNGIFSNNFKWKLENDQDFFSIDSSQVSFTATESTNITAIWLDSQNVCNNVVAENFYLDVLTKPEVITLEANKEVLCEGDAVEFTVGGADLDNFILYNASTDEKVNGAFNGSSVEIIPNKSTDYVAWWLNNECLIVSDTVRITVNEIPSITINNNEKICPNSNFEINIQPTDYSLYLWSGGDIPYTDLVSGFKLNRDVEETELNYSLRISENNCILDTLITLDLVELDVKAISDRPDNEVCEGDPVQLSVDGADSYMWENNEIIRGDLSNKPVAFPTENITALSVNAYKDGCPVFDVIELYLKEKPVATILDKNVTICYGDTVQLEGYGGQNYLWQPNLFLNDNKKQNPVSLPNESITYTLTVIAENKCTDEATVAINVQNDGCEIDLNKIFVPNTITPNSDGINDTWEIPAIADLQDYSVTVFTDFGVVVFSKTGYQNEFSGINGDLLPTGTYYYIIKHINSENKRTGTLTIIR